MLWKLTEVREWRFLAGFTDYGGKVNHKHLEVTEPVQRDGTSSVAFQIWMLTMNQTAPILKFLNHQLDVVFGLSQWSLQHWKFCMMYEYIDIS